jgi:4-amino-4-deoxy-L-arabinose transferase-like glycosyltransferase
LPWFVLVSLRNPEFARFFFIHEHFERFLTKVHGHYQPFWYFVPILLLTMFPWSIYIIRAVRQAVAERHRQQGPALLYLVLWASIIFLFFSLSDSKLIPYTLWYGTAGYTQARFDLDSTIGSLDLDDFSGYFLGLGVESQLGAGWALRAEYRFTQFSSETVFSAPGLVNVDLEPTMHTARVALTYKFGRRDEPPPPRFVREEMPPSIK